MSNGRRPGEGRDLSRTRATQRHEIPASAGMTRFGGLAAWGAAAALLLAGAGVAVAQSGAGVDDETTQAAAAQAGPPPMPQPITMASRPEATGGEALYIQHCIMCHGPNGMGTGLLARRMDVALLEERDNLPAQYVIQAARRGIGNMPAIPRGEVSDAEMQAIADYLAAGPHPRANPQPQVTP